ncbi:hypothetical protein, partial [Candidatus Protofrankia datiscae]
MVDVEPCGPPDRRPVRRDWSEPRWDEPPRPAGVPHCCLSRFLSEPRRGPACDERACAGTRIPDGCRVAPERGGVLRGCG